MAPAAGPGTSAATMRDAASTISPASSARSHLREATW